LPFKVLYVFLGRQYGYHTGYILATHYQHTGDMNKTDARMTPDIYSRRNYVRFKLTAR
jgi:hypothetical protein